MHSAILSTFIKLPSVVTSFVLSIFEWQHKTGLTVFLANQQNDSCTQQGLGSAWALTKGSQLLHADSKNSDEPGHLPRVLSVFMLAADSDRTWQMSRLIWIFAGGTANFVVVVFVTHWLLSFMVHKYSVIIRWGTMLGPTHENTSLSHWTEIVL